MSFDLYINYDALNDDAKKELRDFYEHLLQKYNLKGQEDKEQKSKKDDFFDFINKHRYSVNNNYSFDSDEIYE